jgi:hypothetical protein
LVDGTHGDEQDGGETTRESMQTSRRWSFEVPSIITKYYAEEQIDKTSYHTMEMLHRNDKMDVYDC